jgi:hypothetical protein
MIGNISKSKAEKGDALTFDMLTEAEKASLSPKPDWNQTDSLKADFIKNKPPITYLGLLTDETMLDGIYNKGVYFYEKAENTSAVERLSVEILIVKTNIFRISIGDRLTVTQFRLSTNESRVSQWNCEFDENGDLKSAVITEDGWKKWTPYVVIDSGFDGESTNTLQNKVITKKFSTIDNELTSIKNGEIVVAHSTKATKDIQGNTIHTTYATKREVFGTPIKEFPSTLSPNKSYNFAEPPQGMLKFPLVANDGDVIYATFHVGDVVPEGLAFDNTNTSDIDIEFSPNTGYEIYGKYNGSVWIVGYSEYTITDGDVV